MKKNIDHNKLEDIKFLIRYIEEQSGLGKFIKESEFTQTPLNFKDEQLDRILETLKEEEYEDIETIQGKRNKYFYSKKNMTQQYASLLFNIEEDNKIQTIVDTIRNDSKRFPRTTHMKVFLNQPFCYSQEEVQEILKQIKAREEFQDIKESTASNGVTHMYSNLYLVEDHAKALTQWAEVTRFESI